jgi:hypothetical protein
VFNVNTFRESEENLTSIRKGSPDNDHKNNDMLSPQFYGKGFNFEMKRNEL